MTLVMVGSSFDFLTGFFAENLVVSAALELHQQAMAFRPTFDCRAGVFRGPTKKAMPLGIAMSKLPF